MQLMKPMPQRSAARAAPRVPGRSPRPTACPTRMEAASATPSGTMKVSEARLMATWCPAIARVPSQPIIRATKAKAPNSSVYWQPIGSPSRSIRPRGAHCQISGRSGSRCGRSRRQVSARSSRASSHRLMVVAQAEPMTPSAGAPKWPKMSTQLSAALTRLATTIDDQDRRRAVHGLEALAEHDEEEERQHARREPDGVGRRVGHHLGRLPGERHERLGRAAAGASREAPSMQGDQDAALDSPGDGGIVPRADGLRDDGVEHHQRAHAEHAEPEEVEVAERDRGERDGGEVPDHDRVHHAHQHHPDLDDDDGRRPGGAWHAGPPAGAGADRRRLRVVLIQGRLGGAEGAGSRGWARRRSAKSSRSASSATSARRASTSWASTSVLWASADLGIPAAHPPAVDVAEVAGGDDDEVVQPPDAQAAQGGAHERAAAGLADVEAVGAEGAQQGGERGGDAAGLVGGIQRDR